MSKRLAYLEKVIADGTADSFARYAYALELKSLARIDDALAAFAALREKDAGYVPMYLMCGSMLSGASRPAEARSWLEEGERVASKAGDTKALGEIRDALAALSD